MFVLVITFAAIFLIAIISVGMIVQKIRSGITARRNEQYLRDAQDSLTLYLLGDIEGDDYTEPNGRYQKSLASLAYQLQTRTDTGSMFDRAMRRAALRTAMLDVSHSLSGETQLRLNHAFSVMGFVGEEMTLAQSNRWWIRARACERLRLMHAKEGAEVLVKNLEHENEDVRIEAALSLIDIIGLDALSPILMTMKKMSLWMEVRLSRSILSFGTDAVPHLEQGVKSESHSVQKFCIEMLGILGDVHAVPTLIEYMNYRVPEVQRASLEAFGKIGDARAIPIILKFLQSDDTQTRIAAAKALGNLGSPATVDALNKLLLRDSIDVRLAAAESLSKIGTSGIKTLQYSTQSDDEEVRLVAMQYLHEQDIVLKGNAA